MQKRGRAPFRKRNSNVHVPISASEALKIAPRQPEEAAAFLCANTTDASPSPRNGSAGGAGGRDPTFGGDPGEASTGQPGVSFLRSPLDDFSSKDKTWRYLDPRVARSSNPSPTSSPEP